MLETFRFGRLDSKSSAPRYLYEQKHGKDARWLHDALNMADVGSHWSVSIKNYMREELLMVTSPRVPPKRIPSVYSANRMPLEDVGNFIIVELRMRSNAADKNGAIVCTNVQTVTIKCPGTYLENNSLFIEELGAYLTVETRLHATTAQVVEDARNPNVVDISVPKGHMTANPEMVFRENEALIMQCIERADRILIRVGTPIPKNRNLVPQHIKDLRIAVLDFSFSPYETKQIQYDDTLDADALVIDNLHTTFVEPLELSFSQLYNDHHRAIYIESDVYASYGAQLCGMALFADKEAFASYLHSHKSEELYNELESRVRHLSGNHALRLKVEELNKSLTEQAEKITYLESALATERDVVKELKRYLTAKDSAIDYLKNAFGSECSIESIVADIENSKKKIENETIRLELEREEMERKYQAHKSTQFAAAFKSAAEIVKSFWAIAGVLATAGVAFMKWRTKK